MRAVRTRAKGAVLLALFALLSMVIPFSATAGEAPGVKLELAPKVVMYDDSVTATLTPIGFTPDA